MPYTLTRAILTTIKSAGFNLGQSEWYVGGKAGYMVDASDTKTGERWAVMALTMYDAVVELAVKLEFEVEE
jgi:hypothetical protein